MILDRGAIKGCTLTTKPDYAIWHDGYGVGLPHKSPIRPDRIIRRLSELLL